tara:strand:+ start:552 stop:1025 length:474 start_codon:yes stop_codon:yes gene_type:complete
MADTFKIQYSGKATPIEEVEAADGSKTRIVHSNIDKSIAGSMEYELGGTDHFLEYKSYTTTTGEVSLEHSTIFNKDIDVDWMMITITEAAGSGTPDCKVKLEHGSFSQEAFWVKLIGVGDFTIMPMRGLNQDGSDIELASTSNSTLAKVDILIGEVS